MTTLLDLATKKAFVYGYIPPNPNEFFNWCNIQASFGNPISANNLGLMYWLGLGTKQDNVAAVKYFNKSIESGAIEAVKASSYNLAIMMIFKDIQGPMETVIKLLYKSANLGLPDAMYELGYMYTNINKNISAKWIEKAAGFNNYDANYEMAVFSYYEKKYMESFKYLMNIITLQHEYYSIDRYNETFKPACETLKTLYYDTNNNYQSDMLQQLLKHYDNKVPNIDNVLKYILETNYETIINKHILEKQELEKQKKILKLENYVCANSIDPSCIETNNKINTRGNKKKSNKIVVIKQDQCYNIKMTGTKAEFYENSTLFTECEDTTIIPVTRKRKKTEIFSFSGNKRR